MMFSLRIEVGWPKSGFRDTVEIAEPNVNQGREGGPTYRYHLWMVSKEERSSHLSVPIGASNEVHTVCFVRDRP